MAALEGNSVNVREAEEQELCEIIVKSREDEKQELCETIEKSIDDYIETMKDPSSSDKIRIYWIPLRLREPKRSAYCPRVVSIGPFGDPYIYKEFEVHKVWCMHSLFGRTCKSEETRRADFKRTKERCVEAMLEEVASARACYSESFGYISDVKFAKIMLVDGCFILEVFLRYYCQYSFEFEGVSQVTAHPILDSTSVRADVGHDLLLLENQIPFSVLQKLFHHTGEELRHRSLAFYINFFYHSFPSWTFKLQIGGQSRDDAAHILDFFHKSLTSATGEDQSNRSWTDNETSRITSCFTRYSTEIETRPDPSPTALEKAGVNFQLAPRDIVMTFRTSSWFPRVCGSDMPKYLTFLFYFFGTATVQWTQLKLGEESESFLRNLIAYEQCNPHIPHPVTSYVLTMSKLIKSKEDVEVLMKAQVIEHFNGVSDHEAVLDLFNSILKGVRFTESDEQYFMGFSYDLYKYLIYYPRGNFLSKLKRNGASVISYYFTTRWAVISIVGALILFGLQVAQTYYTVLPSKGS